MRELGIGCALGASVLWAVLYTVYQHFLDPQTSPMKILLVHSLVTSVVAGGYLLVNHLGGAGSTETIIDFKRDWVLLCTGLIAIGANVLMLSSIRLVGASVASMIEITYPLITICLAVFMFGGAINLVTCFSALLILTGSAMLVWKA